MSLIIIKNSATMWYLKDIEIVIRWGKKKKKNGTTCKQRSFNKRYTARHK